MSAVIRKASDQDQDRLAAFAATSMVSMQGVCGEPEGFYLMENGDGRLMAMAGIEEVKEIGLLRSLVIDSDSCSLTEVILFLEAVISSAESSGHAGVALITPSPKMFELLGFERKPDKEVPKALRSLVEASQSQKAAMMVKNF